jgi:acyl-CoA thioesterase-1
MFKKVLIGFGIVIALSVIFVIINLLRLRRDVSAYAQYWQQQVGLSSEQSAQAKQADDFIYVALGDSIGQAIGASKPQNGYVGLIAKHIEQETGRRVRIVNLSVTGAKVSDLLNTQLPDLHKYQPDLITVEIGANDMRSYDSATFRTQYEQLVKALPADKSVIANVPYFGTRKGSNPQIIDANRTVSELTHTYSIPTADVYSSLKAQQSPYIYAIDFFHPNDRGYRIWYNAYLPVIRL